MQRFPKLQRVQSVKKRGRGEQKYKATLHAMQTKCEHLTQTVALKSQSRQQPCSQSDQSCADAVPLAGSGLSAVWELF